MPPDGLAETATAPAEGGAPAPVLRRRRLAAALIEAEPRTGRRREPGGSGESVRGEARSLDLE